MGSTSFTFNGIPFEWDPAKARENRKKHGIDFERACEVFLDPFLRVMDAGNAPGEARQAVIGMTVAWSLLWVVFVERGESIRIISAREATAAERKDYEAQ